MTVESEHNARFMTHHVMKHAFTSNLHKINNANRGKSKLPYYFLKGIKSAMKILCCGWNIHYGHNKNLRNKSNKGKKSCNCNFQTYQGHLHTHWWRHIMWYTWNSWLGTFTAARHILTQEKHALTDCHRCLLAHGFAQFGGYQWRR